jgi:hypothetical protein
MKKFSQILFSWYLVLIGVTVAATIMITSQKFYSVLCVLALWCSGMPWSYIISYVLNAHEYLTPFMGWAIILGGGLINAALFYWLGWHVNWRKGKPSADNHEKPKAARKQSENTNLGNILQNR